MLLYRKPQPEDCQMVYDWICDPLTRAYSYGPPPESYSGHETWFLKRINQETGEYLIFYPSESPQNPAGQVRLDNKDDGQVVSIVTAPQQRGKGYATEMLRIIVALYNEGQLGVKPLRAWIMSNNKPSQKAFINAGFRLHAESGLGGIPSEIYTYP